ncbi:MAG: DNA polymerase/3'-5' exonuclease PolX [Peptococcaceae bacterium]|jgi:DNA polymerase (family 10)|nr:DNA polymerase/3'-5' exonuclease PolX [Peptococcaceae bacterium]MDH7523759.1 DNA polymerase/3'-5' exonuclease PolX [Peptococcaceae bacterium]
MNKHEVARVLREIGLLLELKEDNPFKSRAYYNGARAVELLQEDLQALVSEKKLEGIKGIGKALSEKISELVLTGDLAYYRRLKASLPEGVLELLKIPGLGPKKVKALYEELDISSLRELEYACKENRLVELRGFGGKTQSEVMAAIDYLKKFQDQYYYAEALGQGLALLEEIKKHPGTKEASLAGSIRRAREVVKDIDLVAAGEDTEKLNRFFAGLPQVREVLESGGTCSLVRLETGIRAKLRVVGREEYPYALCYFTGSKEHNAALRRLAGGKGYTISERGLFAGEKKIDCRCEDEIFQVLGLSFIPPELREDNGEIEAANRGRLPQLVEDGDIKGVFHIHTSYSDGVNSLEEMVAEAARLGFQYIGISDHSQSAYYALGLKEDRLRKQQEEIAALREKYPQIAVFSGIESDIRADGSLDYPDEVLDSFDFVVASVHSHFKMPEEEMTRRLVRAMRHPAVTMLGHPTGRLLLAREGYRVNMETILETARENGVIIELNASPARLDLDWRHLRKARELGVLVAINPDAHRLEELNDVYYGVRVARKGWLEKKDVFNCLEAQEIRKYLERRKETIIR